MSDHRLAVARRRSSLLALVAVSLLVGCGSEEGGGTRAPAIETEAKRAKPPSPEEGIPLQPRLLAKRLESTDDAVKRAVERWRADAGLRGRTPRDLVLYALHQQRIYILLTPRERLASAVVGQLPRRLATEAGDILAARRELSSLSTPVPRRRFRTGRALPPRTLLRHYREAQRRFDVSWKVLAAVNFVETAFNKLRNKSTAGAQGPMQFIPSTWEAYGMGGDISDPRDAIMGAANYLRASGAPQNYERALYAYNPSSAYVEAVLRYTRRIRRDRDTFVGFHSWQVFVNTPRGIVRITGPGV